LKLTAANHFYLTNVSFVLPDAPGPAHSLRLSGSPPRVGIRDFGAAGDFAFSSTDGTAYCRDIVPRRPARARG